MLLFGTAGVPRSSKEGNTISGIERIKELGLDAMELEFVHGVNLSSQLAEKVREAKERLGIRLTCHAPYFINLNSDEKPKYEASIKRIMDSARIGFIAGVENVTFHAGFYQGGEPEAVYQKIKGGFEKILNGLAKEKIKIRLTPELTGKGSQFGSLEELLRLASELARGELAESIGVGLCLDISHLHARSGGAFNTRAEFDSVWKQIKKSLGAKGLEDIRIHISGIRYSAKGELEHLNLKDSDFNYKDFVESLKANKIGGIAICESPNLEGDALMLKKLYTQR
ncbi:MAG: TIM barrel protein [Planctomycetes bacterium]|nr:TIM barrel protein [Planctomycetota bacterium]